MKCVEVISIIIMQQSDQRDEGTHANNKPREAQSVALVSRCAGGTVIRILLTPSLRLLLSALQHEPAKSLAMKLFAGDDEALD